MKNILFSILALGLLIGCAESTQEKFGGPYGGHRNTDGKGPGFNKPGVSRVEPNLKMPSSFWIEYHNQYQWLRETVSGAGQTNCPRMIDYSEDKVSDELHIRARLSWNGRCQKGTGAEAVTRIGDLNFQLVIKSKKEFLEEHSFSRLEITSEKFQGSLYPHYALVYFQSGHKTKLLLSQRSLWVRSKEAGYQFSSDHMLMTDVENVGTKSRLREWTFSQSAILHIQGSSDSFSFTAQDTEALVRYDLAETIKDVTKSVWSDLILKSALLKFGTCNYPNGKVALVFGHSDFTDSIQARASLDNQGIHYPQFNHSETWGACKAKPDPFVNTLTAALKKY